MPETCININLLKLNKKRMQGKTIEKNIQPDKKFDLVANMYQVDI